MSQPIKTIFLNALPAAGKSEIRAYLDYLGKEKCRDKFMIGEIVQLDDYPYVHMMRRIDECVTRLGYPRVFFELADRGFISEYDWGTLTHLVCEDHFDMTHRIAKPSVTSAADWLIGRINAARKHAGIRRMVTEMMSAPAYFDLCSALEKECRDLMDEKWKNIPQSMEGKTLVIEFSRGGPHGAKFPLSGANGYFYTYSLIPVEMLENAAILYVHVRPKTSRKKNEARGKEEEDADGLPSAVELMTSLLHRVPDYVMWNSYGCDDIQSLIRADGTPAVMIVKSPSKDRTRTEESSLPIGVFCNEEKDLTSFTHEKDVSKWKEEDKAAMEAELARCFSGLLASYRKMHAPASS